MPTYIVLAERTEQGMNAVDESPSRLDDARELADSLGGEFREFYMTMGDRDHVAVMEMPDDDAMAKLALGKSGNVTTETLKAFTEAEYRDVMANLP